MSGSTRALVIGGSVAGLAAARVLSSRVDEVVVLERDTWSGAEPRKGTPQGHQVHTLLVGGQQALESLFPGITDELVGRGAVPVDFGADVAFRHFGSWKPRRASGLRGTMQSRGLLEHTLRRRVGSLPRVRLVDGVRVDGLRLSPDGARVSGVYVRSSGPEGGDGTSLRSLALSDGGNGRLSVAADVVVDASGRGSRLPGWLVEGGRAPAVEERVPLGISYAGRLYRRDRLEEGEPRARIVYPQPPSEYRSGVLLAIEDEQWLVGFAGYQGRGPGPDPERLHEFASDLSDPGLLRILRRAEPLGPLRRFNVPYQFRRRYERAGALPRGLLVVGDAACSLDPLFGQGMSVTLRAAQRFADRRDGGDLVRMCRRFQGEVARSVRTPWLLTSAEAGRYPEVEDGGRSRLSAPLLRRYAAEVFNLSADDPRVFLAFLHFMHLTRPLASVFSPWLLHRVARSLLPFNRLPLPAPAGPGSTGDPG